MSKNLNALLRAGARVSVVLVALASASVTNAATFNIPADSSGLNPTDFGLIEAGTNVFSGNIDGSCLPGPSAPNCSFGDVGNTSDRFSFLLADGFEITSGTLTITNYMIDGFRALNGLVELDRVVASSVNGFTRVLSGGNTVENLLPSFFGTDANGDTVVSLFATGSTSELVGTNGLIQTFQGVGDISFDYEFSIDVADTTPQISAVPLPAGLPLLAGGLGLFGWLASRKRTDSTV